MGFNGGRDGSRPIFFTLVNDLKDRTQDVAKYVETRVGLISVSIRTIHSILISALETLLEIVLILVTGNTGLITVSPSPIDSIVGIVVVTVTISAVTNSGVVSLPITLVYRVLQHLILPLIVVIVPAAAIYAIVATAACAIGVPIVPSRSSAILCILALSLPLCLLPVPVITRRTSPLVIPVFFLGSSLSLLPFTVFFVIVLRGHALYPGENCKTESTYS